MLPSASREDLLGFVAVVALIGVIVGLAASILWFRDRIRGWRRVPDWIKQRGELRAKKIGAAYAMFWSGAFSIYCVAGAVRFHRTIYGILLLVPAICGLLVVRSSWVAYRHLARNIKALERDHQAADLSSEKK